MSKPNQWHGCYDGNQGKQKDLFTPESIAHPAKMSITLIERILDHGQDRGYWSPGDLLIDPFGGICTTGLVAAYRGYPTFSCELEQNFVDLGNANIEKNRRKLERLGNALPILVQGDSRNLVDLIAGANGAVTSPPYSVHITKNRSSHLEADRLAIKNITSGNYGLMKDKSLPIDIYGKSEGQIGEMPEGDHAQVVGALSSPPYADARIGETSGAAQVGHGKNYGQADGQLGSMPEGDVNQVIAGITSPPYEDSVNSKNSGIDWDKAGRPERNSPSNTRVAVQAGGLEFSYGQSPGQVGAESGDSYWQSVSTIYQQVYQLLPPGGVFAVVVKDFVRDWQRIPLCDQTAELLEAIGFTVIERIHAMLVKEIPQTINMFTGEATPKLVERKSFFRRLLENKGSPRIDYEEVIFVRKTSNDK